MKNILEDMYKTAVSPESGNKYGGDELDWIHLNSLDIIGNDIVLSSRELSSIIYIEDIYQNPKLKYIISDLSIYKNTKYEKYVYSKNGEFVVDPKEIDFAILTHNHLDHQGRFALLVKQGFKGKIYTTNITQRILGKALYDNFRVQKNTTRYGELSYDEEDVVETLNRVVGCDYNQTIEINNFIKIQFIPNGHLIGAASVLVQIHYTGFNDINILFSGDYNNKNMFFRVPEPRKWIRELPLNIVTESTYGYMDSCEIKRVFRKNILGALKDGKTIIIPVFSLGRAQEILYILKEMQSKYNVFANIPIYYDGKLSFAYTDEYHHMLSQGILHFYKGKEIFEPIGLKRVESRELRQLLMNQKNAKIIVTTSGMGSYGAAQSYIKEYISKPNALIHFTGYTSEGTLGSKLKNAEFGDDVEVGGLIVKKLAEVDYTTEYSAHAKADEMIEFLQKFNNLKLVLVNHGQDDVKVKFAKRILNEVETKYVGILGRDYFFRVDRYGLRKTLSTKFK